MNIYARIANYISRYAPSRAKISEYLQKKGREDYEKILSEIGYNESLMLDMWIRTFLATGKSEIEIKQKLLLKKFKKDDIINKIAEFSTEITDFYNYENFIKNFIESKKAKGKSITFIKNELFSKFPYFKEEINELLQNENDDFGLQKEIEKYSKKYNLNDSKDLQKFYSALMRKGFKYQEIKNFLKK